MAVWVPQNEFSSITRSSRERVAYLSQLRGDVRRAIEAYFIANPMGEDVTLAVLKEIGEEQLRTISRNRSFDRAKQDAGLLVPITLVDMFTANRVMTLRRDNRKSVSTRRNTIKGMDWVSSYAPHRVLPEISVVERIILDTNIVRKFIHGDSEAMNFASLKELKRDHPVSIGDAAIAEIVLALFRSSISFTNWSSKIHAVDSVLDPDFPVAPGGRELASIWGSHSCMGIDLGETKARNRAAWQKLSGAKSIDDLTIETIFTGPTGQSHIIRFDQATCESVLRDAAKHWASHFNRAAEELRECKKQGHSISEEALIALQHSGYTRQMGESDANKLDLISKVYAKRMMQSIMDRSPFRAKEEPNDPLDIDLLFGIPLPAWICTSDARLLKLVKSTNSRDANNVMTPQDLLHRLQEEI